VASAIFEGFSVSHAQILDGATAFAAAVPTQQNQDIYGVNEASLDVDDDEYDNEGDDSILSVWSWINKATINVQAGYISFPVIANITGRPISSSGAGATQVLELDLWHENDFNVAPKPMLIRIPSRDNQGAVRRIDIGLYHVDFKPITFDGPTYKDGLKVNYNGSATFSSTSETGTVFADGKRRFGKIISAGP
jgi:hypothetical protein